MRVLVRAFAKFREMAGEESAIDLEEGSTLCDLLEEVASSHPEIKDGIFTPDGNIGDGVTILLNRKGIDLSDPGKTVLEEGDEVALLPPFSGG